MHEPNFFIVGAAKAGTTSLYHYLDQHPDIYMSPLKEPCYFAFEVRPENFGPDSQLRARQAVEDVRRYLNGSMNEKRSDGIICHWKDYIQLFAGATTETAVGESSVSYLWSRTAARQIAAQMPQAKIIMVLRSPAERAFSQYLHAVSDGYITESFQNYVRASLRYSGERFSLYHPFLEMGFYTDQVQRYFDHFPRRQIGIWFYEETAKRPREFFREVLEFLGVDSTFAPDTSKRHNQPHIARMVKPAQALRRLGVWQMLRRATPAPLRARLRGALYRPTGSVTMDAADRSLMLDFYRGDIHRLEGLLNRDLSAWLV
jgi:hypothetical protein